MKVMNDKKYIKKIKKAKLKTRPGKNIFKY